MHRKLVWASCALAAFSIGCGASPEPSTPPADAGAPDAAIPSDRDGGAPDAATPPPDAATEPDAGRTAVVLTNADFDSCASRATIQPILPDEAGHLASARLTPRSYPFVVAHVGYALEVATEDGSCSATLAHRVELYVTTTDAPDGDPADAGSLVATLNVPALAEPPAEEYRHVELALDAPIELAEGQSLHIAVEMAGEGAQGLCIAACADGGGTAGVNYWSNAAAAPYAWADLVAAFGFTADLTAWASGETP